MKYFCRLLIVFALMLTTIVSCEAAKKTLAIMPLESVSNNEDQRIVAEMLTDQLIVEFHNSGRYTLIERDQMGKILREQGFQSLTSDKPVAIGEMVGAQLSLVGRLNLADAYQNEANRIAQVLVKGETRLVNKYKARIMLEYRIVDNETGITIFTAGVTGTKSGNTLENAVRGACKEAAENAIKALEKANPFAARIAETSGDLIYIDAGLDSGLKLGEKLIITREEKPIEINGKIVGMTQSEVGQAKVTEIHTEYSICRVTSHSGAVQKGDIVKREQQ